MSIQLSETVRIDTGNAYGNNVSNVDNSSGNTKYSVKMPCLCMLCKMCDVRVCIGLVVFVSGSLLMLVLAYMIIVMLIVVYEVTECHFSHLLQIFHTGNHSIH